jgi:hypothetical protein
MSGVARQRLGGARYNRTASRPANNNSNYRDAPSAAATQGRCPLVIYLKWTQSELATLNMGALYTEVDEDGWVQRELGIGDDGLVTHQLVPSDARPGWFGLARLSLIMLTSNVSKAEFETLWHSGAARSSET